jgi:CHAT domain-containing protein
MVKKLCIREQNKEIQRIQTVIDQAQKIARPKAVYKAEHIESHLRDALIVQGYQLTSKILQNKTREATRIFPFIATCGHELSQWLQEKTDFLEQYYAQTLLERMLRDIVSSLQQSIQKQFAISQLSHMQPGSLVDWPIQEQAILFHMLENGAQEIGVCLTSSLLMLPKQSLSGVFFYTQEPFVSCQLCPIEDCPDRQTPQME